MDIFSHQMSDMDVLFIEIRSNLNKLLIHGASGNRAISRRNSPESPAQALRGGWTKVEDVRCSSVRVGSITSQTRDVKCVGRREQVGWERPTRNG